MKLLFTPVRIGNLEIRNRIVVPPMCTGFSSEDGQVTERMTRYYEEKAKGGAGLVIVEFSAIERRGRALPFQLMIDNDSFIPGLRTLANAIKRCGARAAIQLHHGGIRASARFTQIQPVGPSAFSMYPRDTGPAPRALTIKEIHNLVLAFGESARRAKESGFELIELHFTNSYLIDQFLSPRFNHRTDMYGGHLENRARFACQIVECVKEKVGRDYPIICRITGDDYVEGGTTINDAKVYGKLLVRSGADCLHVSVGTSENMVVNPPLYVPRGCFLHLSKEIKRVVNVPVIAVGRIDVLEFAEQALIEEKADLVAMGRAFIADPHFPLKAEKGETADIIPCIYCNQGCVTRLFNGSDITCLMNPTVGREREYRVLPAKAPRKVLIVGAGPAGLQAAIIAKQRGHEVVLAEKREDLGGQLNYAYRPPMKEEIKKAIDFFSIQIKKLGVRIHLGKLVDKEFIKEIQPDIIVMATGSTPRGIDIPGIKEANAKFATEILTGKQVLGETAIVIGGGQVGLETADFLAEMGKKVTILEMMPEVGIDIPPRNKMFLMKRLLGENVRVLTNREVKEVCGRTVRASYFSRLEEYSGDEIVLAVGSNPDRALLGEIEAIIPGLEGFYMIGDCIEPRKALEAIQEGFRIGMEI